MSGLTREFNQQAVSSENTTVPLVSFPLLII